MDTNSSYAPEMTTPIASYHTTTEDPYDSQGALVFTVAVLIIYGSSIFAFIGYSIKSSAKDKSSQDKEIQQFLTNKGKLQRLTVLDEVMESRKLFRKTGLTGLQSTTRSLSSPSENPERLLNVSEMTLYEEGSTEMRPSDSGTSLIPSDTSHV